jgi:cysteinyl-tRNA synthetase
MALELLGEGFSLHGGGEDLKFPHHENERAQAVALGRQFARHWMHNGMVMQGGEKMSKSIGNVVDLSSLTTEYDPRTYRLVVLQAHYRAPVEVTTSGLDAAERTLRGIDALARRLEEAGGVDTSGVSVPADEISVAFRRHMDDDLSTPLAMAVAFDALKAANSSFDRSDAVAGVGLGRAALGCFEAVGLKAATVTEVKAEALDLAGRRDKARAAKDWAAADRLRDEIVALGYRVEDAPSGTRVLR